MTEIVQAAAEALRDTFPSAEPDQDEMTYWTEAAVVALAAVEPMIRADQDRKTREELSDSRIPALEKLARDANRAAIQAMNQRDDQDRKTREQVAKDILAVITSRPNFGDGNSWMDTYEQDRALEQAAQIAREGRS